jgi:hypothetical protein
VKNLGLISSVTTVDGAGDVHRFADPDGIVFGYTDPASGAEQLCRLAVRSGGQIVATAVRNSTRAPQPVDPSNQVMPFSVDAVAASTAAADRPTAAVRPGAPRSRPKVGSGAAAGDAE